MYYPSKEEFLKLSKKGNLIPVYKEILADLETPVSAFMKIDDNKYSYLLESVEGGKKIARFSFLGSDPSLVIKSKGRKIEILNKLRNSKFKVRSFKTFADPLSEVKKLMQKYKFVSFGELPRFCGGLVGYIGYEMVKLFEPRLQLRTRGSFDDLGLPDSIFMLSDRLLIFDHINHKIKILQNVFLQENSPSKVRNAYDWATQRIDEVIERLRTPLKRERILRRKPFSMKARSNFSKEKYERIVRKAKTYIKKGDIIQVVLSQRFKLKLGNPSFDVYRSLRSLNPSPYMFFLRFKDLKLLGSSPELLVRCEKEQVEARPIAGTRPRGKTEGEDERFKTELLSDPKEKAEHLMLVDLGRNDLGRVCKFGTVTVSEFMYVEKYSHVMHIVSSVRGELRSKDSDEYDLVRAAFPAGTVCGAPKIRAMEIIDELEKVVRGPYAGCVGYFSFSKNLDTCITIRSIVVKGSDCFVQAGAGIVADSVPEREYFETINKAKAQIRAIQIAKEFMEV